MWGGGGGGGNGIYSPVPAAVLGFSLVAVHLRGCHLLVWCFEEDVWSVFSSHDDRMSYTLDIPQYTRQYHTAT